METHRKHWPVACINETFADKYGVEQTLRLKLGRQRIMRKVRPIVKIVLLVEEDSPSER